jgi:hypothetical protein
MSPHLHRNDRSNSFNSAPSSPPTPIKGLRLCFIITTNPDQRPSILPQPCSNDFSKAFDSALTTRHQISKRI